MRISDVSSIRTMRSLSRNVRRQGVEQRRLAGARSAGDEDVLAGLRPQRVGRRASGAVSVPTATSSSSVYRCVNFRMVSVGPVDGARREHRGHARAVLEPGVEQRLHARRSRRRRPARCS